MTGDPIAAWVNGWKIAGTCNDIILQIMKSEMARNVAGDKFARVSFINCDILVPKSCNHDFFVILILRLVVI